MTIGDWIGIGAMATTVLVAYFGYLRKPAFVPAHQVEDLRNTIKELRDEISDLREQISELKDANRALERSRTFWQEHYEDSRSGRNRGDQR